MCSSPSYVAIWHTVKICNLIPAFIKFNFIFNIIPRRGPHAKGRKGERFCGNTWIIPGFQRFWPNGEAEVTQGTEGKGCKNLALGYYWMLQEGPSADRCLGFHNTIEKPGVGCFLD